MSTNRHNQIMMIAKISIVSALYVVLTVAISPLSYGDIQIRFSEVLLLLCFFDKRYSYGLIIGCFVANLFSPIQLDIIFGTLQTMVSVALISFVRPLILSLSLSTLSTVIIGFEIALISDLKSWWLYSLTVMAGEAIVLLFIAYPLSFLLKRNKIFMKVVDLNGGRL